MSSSKVRVRFHLGAGEHYQHWQIRLADGRVEYIDPDHADIVMFGCRLRNQRHAAARIHAGENKAVCAWVECESVSVFPPQYGQPGDWVGFNPRVAPHWRDASGADLDGQRFASITSQGRHLFIDGRDAVSGKATALTTTGNH